MPVSASKSKTKPGILSVQYMPRLEDRQAILIYSESEQAVEEIDGIIRALLEAYDEDLSAPEARTEFTGSHFIRYRLHRKSGDLEEDISLELRDQPPRKNVPEKKRSLLAKLRRRLTKLNVVLAVAGTLSMSVFYGRELYENFLKAFKTKPEASVTLQVPAQIAGHDVVVYDMTLGGQIIVLDLPPAMITAIENAENDPEKFKLLMQFLVANHFEAPAASRPASDGPQHKQHQTKPRLKDKKRQPRK